MMVRKTTKTRTSPRRNSAAKKSPARKTKTAKRTSKRSSTTRSGGANATAEIDLSKPFVPPVEPTKPETISRVAEAEQRAAEARQVAAQAEQEQRDAWQAERGEILETMQTAMDRHTAEVKAVQDQFEKERAEATQVHTAALAEKRQSHEQVMGNYRTRLDAVSKKLGIAAPTIPGSPLSGEVPALPKGSDIDPALWARITQPVPYEITSVREAALTVHFNAGDDQVPSEALRYAVAHFLGRNPDKVSGQIPNACNTLRSTSLISNRGCDRGCNKITAKGKAQVGRWTKEASELTEDTDVDSSPQAAARRAAVPELPQAGTNGHAGGRKNPLGPSDRYIVLAVARAEGELDRGDLARAVLGLKYDTRVRDPEQFKLSLNAGINKAVEAKEIKVTPQGRKSMFSITAKGKKVAEKLDKEAKKLGVV